MFEFQPGGAVDFSPGAVVEAKYRIEGGQLILPPPEQTGSEQRQAIEWVGDDKIRLKVGDKPAEELSRKGPRTDANNPIIGEWNGYRDMGKNRVELRWFFYPTGKLLLLIPFTTQHAHYSVDQQTLRIDLSDRKVEGKFDVQGDVLTIPGPSGSGESRFARY